MLILSWNGIDTQSREQILGYACMNERLQHYGWDELQKWQQVILQESLESRSKNSTTISR